MKGEPLLLSDGASQIVYILIRGYFIQQSSSTVVTVAGMPEGLAPTTEYLGEHEGDPLFW